MSKGTNPTARFWVRQAAALTEEEANWLLATRRRRRAGEVKLTNAEIGAKIGKSAHWVSNVCSVLGSRARADAFSRAAVLSEQDVTLFTQMWADGVSMIEIGRRWGFTKWWAAKKASRLGLPSRTKFVTNRQVAEIRRRAAAGETQSAIAEAVGVGRTTVRVYGRGFKAAVVQTRRAPPRVNAGLADRMARSGMRHKEIAAHFGVDRTTATKAIARYRKRLEARSAQKPKFLIPPVRIAA